MGGVKMKEKIKKIINQVFEEKGIKVEKKNNYFWFKGKGRI